MNDWRAQLREHDPAADTVEPERVEQIRSAVIAVARTGAVHRSHWPRRLALATVAVALLAGGGGDDRRSISGQPETLPSAPGSEVRTQIRFSTPGGTRIIWEINPGFSLTETLP